MALPLVTCGTFAPDPIKITLDPGSTFGNSAPETINYQIQDSNYTAGDPDVPLTTTLEIIETAQYEFSSGGSLITITSDTLRGGQCNGSIPFTLRNKYNFGGANPVAVTLRVTTYETALGTGFKHFDSKLCTVTV